MILSMTGYGKGVIEDGARVITAEIRALNNKFLDINLRMPQEFRDREMQLRKRLSTEAVRGKLDVTLSVEAPGREEERVLSREAILTYHTQLQEIAVELGQPINNPFGLILPLPGVTAPVVPEDVDRQWELVEAAFTKALDALQEFRLQEGANLAADLRERIEAITGLREQVMTEEPARRERVRARLMAQLEEWSGTVKGDENRLEQEMIYYIEKLDITEEIVRLDSHLNYFRTAMDTTDSAQGKKLGFVAQEIGREINTIGSKANDAGIQQIVVQMKDELEKIKEQLLNII